MSAHEVRALSASTSVFRGMTVDTVLQSCTWKSRNTFSDFYLRDMCSLLDDSYVMASSIAGTYISILMINTCVVLLATSRWKQERCYYIVTIHIGSLSALVKVDSHSYYGVQSHDCSSLFLMKFALPAAFLINSSDVVSR